MSDTAHSSTIAVTTDHDSENHGIDTVETENAHEESGADPLEHGALAPATTQREGVVPITIGTTGTVTTSDDRPDEVSEGHDGYEYHQTTAVDHELHATDLRDTLLAGALGDDKLVGGTHNDILDGSDGNNTLDGGSGNDVLIAGGDTNHGRNHLNGGSGDDVLVAGGTKTHALDDFLRVNPTLAAALTNDPKYVSLSTLVKGTIGDTGGGSVNTFELQSASGHDSIFNFHAATDVLEIHRGLNGSDIRDVASLASHMHVSGNDVTIDLGSGNSLTLVGVDVAHLSAANVTWL